jgi:hypothetical protein
MKTSDFFRIPLPLRILEDDFRLETLGERGCFSPRLNPGFALRNYSGLRLHGVRLH